LLVNKYHLIDRIIENTGKSNGYQGYLILFTTALLDTTKQDNSFKTLLITYPTWGQYIEEIYNPNLKNQKFIINPNSSIASQLNFIPITEPRDQDEDSNSSSGSSSDDLNIDIDMGDITGSPSKGDSLQELLNSINKTISSMNNGDDSTDSTSSDSDDEELFN